MHYSISGKQARAEMEEPASGGLFPVRRLHEGGSEVVPFGELVSES